jgi:hypothetical protein
MRKSCMAVMAALLGMVSVSALAGNLTFSEGRPQWQSTRCAEPAMPPSLMAVDKETRANDMNGLMESYNDYAAKMQDYMNCVSNEAEADSSTTSQSIIQSAQTVIGIAQGKVSGLQIALRGK